ncbi:alpha/beta hydrolase [Shewanella sp. AS1]|uniref:alpha/beta hydrolase n=1 Tax=Shewanella sp. AS1 TaxID=2907626 RepID=UPI001F2A2AA6|nr:alpha/beta hydrolase [Shewanella sp. AS1]MCE9680518.1 alpha/beta hydrolase [Shewanella sp. AS1]
MLQGSRTRSAQARRRLSKLACLAYASLAFIAIAGLTPTQVKAQPQVGDESCYVDGLSDRLRCGFVNVPENYSEPDGKQIQIHYVVLPAIKPSFTQEALLAIAGGPGQSAIENAAGFDRIFNKVRQQRDILLIDQRGTGLSSPLQCTGESFEGTLAFDETDLDIAAEIQKCRDGLTADVRQYGSETALKDFEAVRTHLGYQKLHIYGISYGSRMAQLYMRHYPEAIATVTLDGVVPMQQSVLNIGDAIARAFKLLFEDCQNNSLCHQQFGQLETEFNQVNQQLAKAPMISQTRDPLTFEPTQLTMTQNKFMGAIRMALYSTNVRALLPHAIHQAAQGNFQPLMGLYALTVNSTGMAMGMHASVVCAEDWQRFKAQKSAEQANYFSTEMLKGIDQTCPIWDMASVDDSFSAPIDSDLPTLLLSGEIDPATPPSWGEMAMEKLTNAKHFIDPYATHGVAYQSCANELIAQLISSGSVEKLSDECLHKDVSRNFYLNANTVEQLANQADTQGATQ